MPSTYFANDLSGITQAQLQDEAQRLAADADRRKYFADLARTRAEQYKADRDAAARMYQTSAYRDVGMNDADVRRQIGMTDADVRRQIGLGEIGVRGEDTRSKERIAGLPYEKMTPAQAAQNEIEKGKLEIMKANPYLLGGNPRIQSDMMHDQQLKDELRRVAETANENLRRVGGAKSAIGPLTSIMDSYGKMGQGLWNNWFSNEAGDTATKIATGEDLPSDMVARPAVQEGMKAFETIVQNAIPGDAATKAQYLPYLRFDTRSGKWRSMYDIPLGGGQSTTDQQSGGTNRLITVNAPPATASMVSTQGQTLQRLPRYRITPQGGILETNSPAAY